MNVRGADFIAYYVTDLERSVAFYRDVLKLPLEIHKPEWNWAEFRVHPMTLTLFGAYPGAPVRAGQRGAVGIALSVDNVSKSIEALRKADVTVAEEPRELSGCYMATILDLDGNPIFLHERKDGTFA